MKFSEIQKLAVKNGAGEWAVKKWRVRKRIPLEWQMKLVKAEPGILTFSDFEVAHKEVRGK